MSNFHNGTQFRKGNKFWKARTTHGRAKLFETPEVLWAACLEYFEWVEENPLWEHKIVSFQGIVTETSLPKMRAMTITGLCIFLDIDQKTWNNYGNDKAYSDFFPIVERVKEIIYDQKFTGAAADMLNPNIIARDLGLADKSQIDHTSNGKEVKAFNQMYSKDGEP